MRSEVVAKIAAYKAYRLGRDAVAQGRRDEVARLALKWLDELGQDATARNSLDRRLFYTLVLAEVQRDGDPAPFREAALDLGEKLARAGAFDPFPHYMQIVAATTGRVSSGNYGDIGTPCAELIRTTDVYTDGFGKRHDVDLARAALGLLDADLAPHAKFLAMSLSDVAQHHGLVGGEPAMIGKAGLTSGAASLNQHRIFAGLSCGAGL